MKEKITLSIDKEIIEKANRHAREQGMSISKMVETYLETYLKGKRIFFINSANTL